jgi:hypothetical protein
MSMCFYNSYNKEWLLLSSIVDEMFNVLLFNVVVLFVRLILEYCDLFSTMYVIYECKYIYILL